MNRLLTLFLTFILCGCAFGQDAPSALKGDGSYRLQPGDSLEVLYRYTPEYNQTVTVQPDGSVSLQLIGNVKVGGLTLSNATGEISRRAGKRLLNPEVSISLKDFEKPHFTVLGEVTNPGRFELRGHISPVDAMAMAGGFKPTARHTQIVLIHRLNATTGEAQLLNFKQLEKAKSARAADDFPLLRDGDLLVVPQNKLSKVERLVRLTGIGLYYPL